MPANTKATGRPAFTADLAEKMRERGYTPATLADRVLNPETGKPLDGRRIYSYLGRGTRPTSPSLPIWKQLEALLPGLAAVDTAGVLNKGPSIDGHTKPKKSRKRGSRADVLKIGDLVRVKGGLRVGRVAGIEVNRALAEERFVIDWGTGAQPWRGLLISDIELAPACDVPEAAE